jgi:hypothetical protein
MFTLVHPLSVSSKCTGKRRKNLRFLGFQIEIRDNKTVVRKMAPQVVAHPGTRTTKGLVFMATHTISPAGDPFTARRGPSSRHIRCDEDFLELLEEDFGISVFTSSP